MGRPVSYPRWGVPPWSLEFQPVQASVPGQADFAVVGGGFTGLAAAAWLARTVPGKTVVLFESASVGAGASGHTGGMVLSETAAGDLPGLGDVLAGYSSILKELSIDCDLALPGVWEIGRSGGLADSPIRWTDSGLLCAVKEVPGGMVGPGKVVSGLARAAEAGGAKIFENLPVDHIEFGDPVKIHFSGGDLRARKVLLATNALSLELSGLAAMGEPKFTLALATEPLDERTLESLGLASQKAFYTVDFPYLWGRLLRTGGVIFGAGLVHLHDWREFSDLDIATGEPAALVARLESRVRKLHPALEKVDITHRWGGPILLANHWRPVFAQHPRSTNVVVLGGYSGHGVALSVYLGCWAAEVLCGRRPLPNWSLAEESA